MVQERALRGRRGEKKIAVDVCVIAANNRDFTPEMADVVFAKTLYFRLREL